EWPPVARCVHSIVFEVCSVWLNAPIGSLNALAPASAEGVVVYEDWRRGRQQEFVDPLRYEPQLTATTDARGTELTSAYGRVDRFWSAPGVLCGVVHCQPLRRAADHRLSSRIDSVALAPHVVWASAVSDGSRSVAFRRRPFRASTISHKFRYSSGEQTI